MTSKEYMLWLHNIPGIGIKSIQNIIGYFGDAKEVFQASAEKIYQIPNLTLKQKESIIKNKDFEKIQGCIDFMHKQGIEYITIDESAYPKALKNIYDPPTILYYKGSIVSKDSVAVAIVGSRKSTVYGHKVAYELAGGLARYGITIVSGMARGIDTYAHEGALSAGGRTIGVLGCGVEQCYPPENKNLKSRIEENGAVVSEFPVGTPPLSNHFPARNRIISGLSLGVIVVEAAGRSGSLITADLAMEQGREVFAVPGNITSKMSEGCNELIKQGCKIVTCVEDVLECLHMELQYTLKQEDKPAGLKITLEGKEKNIYDCIEDQPIYIEEILSKVHLTIGELSGVLTVLELKGLIKQLPGKYFIRT